MLENYTPTPESSVVKSPLYSITPFSKYFAMALFVILPFVGGWIGYTSAPEKIIEIEKVVLIKEVDSTESVSNNLNTPNDGTLVKYENETLGVTFEYPSYWGEIVNIGSDTHIMLSFTNLTESPGDSHFLSAKSKINIDEARGGYWGDMTNEISEAFCADEKSKNECLINQYRVEIYAENEREAPGCGGINDVDSKTYFVPTRKPELQPVMVFTDARIATKECTTRNQRLESEFKAMTDSVQYLN